MQRGRPAVVLAALAVLLTGGTTQAAGHLASQLLVFGTGAEIEFTDRDAVTTIVGTLAARRYPVRSMIREVVRSGLFGSR